MGKETRDQSHDELDVPSELVTSLARATSEVINCLTMLSASAVGLETLDADPSARVALVLESFDRFLSLTRPEILGRVTGGKDMLVLLRERVGEVRIATATWDGGGSVPV